MEPSTALLDADSQIAFWCHQTLSGRFLNLDEAELWTKGRLCPHSCGSQLRPWLQTTWTRRESPNVDTRPHNILLFHTRAFGNLCISDRHSNLCIWDRHLQSAHTAAVGCREPLNCLPCSLGVHKGHGLIAGRPTAGVTADLFSGDAPIVHQSLEGQVIVPAGAVACANTVFKEDYLIWVIAEAKIPHPHLLPLQMAVTAAFGLLAVPPWCSGQVWFTGGAPPSILVNILFLQQWHFFYKE